MLTSLECSVPSPEESPELLQGLRAVSLSKANHPGASKDQEPRKIQVRCVCRTCPQNEPDPSQFSEYQHVKLTGPGYARIFTMFPDNKGQPLRGTVEEISLTVSDPDSAFDALSYTWINPGNEATASYVLDETTKQFAWEAIPKPHIIIIDETSYLPITCGVHSALIRLRSPTKPLRIFVDALCIDQGSTQHSLAERASQIRSMGDIYAKAEIVHVDLGDQDDGAVEVLPLFRHLAGIDRRSSAEAVKKMKENGDPSLMRRLVLLAETKTMNISWTHGLLALSRRKWWRRIWTLQEVLCAHQVVFHVNSLTIDSLTLRVGIKRVIDYRPALAVEDNLVEHDELLREFQERSIEHCYHYMDLLYQNRRQGRMSSNQLGMMRAIRKTGIYECTIDHDQIYALLGLATEQERNAITLDYKIPLQAVLRQFSRHVIESENSLDLFYLFQQETPGLPTWVLNPRSKNINDTFAICAQSDLGHPPFSADGGTAYHVSFDDSDLLLSLQAIDIGSITATTTSPWSMAGLGQFHKWCLESYRLSLSCKHSNGSTHTEDFWTTLCAGRVFGLVPALGAEANLEAILSPLLATDSLFDEDSVAEDLFDYYKYMDYICEGRRFGITNECRMCLLPGHAREGDKAMVIFGLRLPFVVRPMSNGTYRLIGCAYVHNFMHGEALNLDKEHWKTITIE